MRYIVWVVFLMLVVARPLFAQPDQAFRQDASVRLGPVYLAPTIALKEFGVDTNVFNANGDQQSDFFLAVTPQTDVWVPFGHRALLTATTAGDAVFFRRFATERSIDPRGQVRGEVTVGRVTWFGAAAWLRSRQRPNFEIDIRARRLEQTAATGVDIRLLQKVSVVLARQLSRVDFDGEAIFFGTSLSESLNRQGRGTTAAVRYQVTPLTSIVLRGERFDDRFRFSPVRNARSESLAPGVEFKAGALISGTASVGVRRFRTFDDRVPDFQGTTASADLSYRLLGATTFRAIADRDVAYSFEPSQPYYLRSGYGLSVSRPLAGPFNATVGVQRHRYAYRDASDRTAAENARADVTRVLSASIDYQISDGNRFGVTASYWTRESNRGARGYTGLRLGASATYGL